MTRFANAAALLLATSLVACSTPLDEYVCSVADDCTSGDEEGEGICEADGFCSFADSTCPSNRRYGSASGRDSNLCVEAGLDAGVDAQTPDSDGANGCFGDAFDFPILNVDGCEDLEFGSELVADIPGNYFLDTDTGTLEAPNDIATALSFAIVTQNEGPELFVLTPANFRIDAGTTIVVRGSRPAVVLSGRDIRIDGKLLAAAKGNVPGPGGNLAETCETGRGSNGETQVPGIADAL